MGFGLKQKINFWKLLSIEAVIRTEICIFYFFFNEQTKNKTKIIALTEEDEGQNVHAGKKAKPKGKIIY